ncbi:hypothetical protein HJFPF1_09750 [Paramyrothecium foliicola]|nr:hypothetical protein HJFPF1_09750 [Paramyrothecium foliicola]
MNTIFEYLTAENPRVTSPEGIKPDSESGRPIYLKPSRLLPWKEFNMNTFKAMFDKRLMREAHKGGRSFQPPLILAHESNAHDEKTTEWLLVHWNVVMTKAALWAVRDELHPTIWSAETRPRKEPGTNSKAPRPLVADGGGIVICEICQISDVRSRWQTRERLPKEIKPYPKFDSTRILPMLSDEGWWDAAYKNQGEELPIKQAYTYCVKRLDHWLDQKAASMGSTGIEEKRFMLQALRTNGLMEYVVVPWRNHKAHGTGEYLELTVNFSLWVLHILAGNNHEVDWSYKRLVDELLVPGPCSPPDAGGETPTTVTTDGNEAGEITPATTIATSYIESPLRERSRRTDAADITASFQADETIPEQSANPPSYLDNESSTEEDDDEAEPENYTAPQSEPPARRRPSRATKRVPSAETTQPATPRKRARPNTRSMTRALSGSQDKSV